MLTPIREGHSIVIAGSWNVRIFSPQWVLENLVTTPAADVTLSVSTNSPALPLRLQFEGVYLHTGSDRLMLLPVTLNDHSLEHVQAVADRLLTQLPHTPLTAIGVNLTYLEDQPAPELLSLFQGPDIAPLSDLGTALKTSYIRRTIEIEGKILNLALELRSNNKLAIDFNYHSEPVTSATAREHLAYGFLNYQTLSKTLLEKVYDPTVLGAHVN